MENDLIAIVCVFMLERAYGTFNKLLTCISRSIPILLTFIG